MCMNGCFWESGTLAGWTDAIWMAFCMQRRSRDECVVKGRWLNWLLCCTGLRNHCIDNHCIDKHCSIVCKHWLVVCKHWGCHLICYLIVQHLLPLERKHCEESLWVGRLSEVMKRDRKLLPTMCSSTSSDLAAPLLNLRPLPGVSPQKRLWHVFELRHWGWVLVWVIGC